MIHRLHKAAVAGTIGVLMAGIPAALHAAERVYLRNGSDLVCDHQKNLNGEVRLYLTASEDNYLDVSPSEILRQEVVVPEPVKTPVQSVAAQPGVPTSAELAALLEHAGAEHHIDPDLLASLVHAESDGNASAVSRVGAAGLMQLMPATAKDLGVGNRFAADENVAGGTTYLDALLMYYHDNLALALAAYNAGPAAVNRYGGIPPYVETRRYVERVIHDYNRRKRQEARQRSRCQPQAEMAVMVAHP